MPPKESGPPSGEGAQTPRGMVSTRATSACRACSKRSRVRLAPRSGSASSTRTPCVGAWLTEEGKAIAFW